MAQCIVQPRRNKQPFLNLPYTLGFGFHLLLCGSQYVLNVGRGNDDHAIHIPNDQVTRGHGDPAHRHWNAQPSCQTLCRSAGVRACCEDWKAAGSQRSCVARGRIDHKSTELGSCRLRRHEIAEKGTGGVSLAVHDNHVAWLCDGQGHMEHQVVAWPHLDGERGATYGHAWTQCSDAAMHRAAAPSDIAQDGRLESTCPLKLLRGDAIEFCEGLIRHRC